MAEEAPKQTLTTDRQRNVLIGVDGSKHSERAFLYYLNVIHKSEDLVIVFHAETLPSLPVHYTLGYPYDEFQEIMDKHDEDARALLKHYGEILKTTKPGAHFKLIKERGRAGVLICKNIEEENITFAVLGSRGLGTLRRTFLGSVSSYVVHHSHKPVCVVPPESLKS